MNGSRRRVVFRPTTEYGRQGRREETAARGAAEKRRAIADQSDPPARARARRTRGPRCATKRVDYYLIGDRLVKLRERQHPWTMRRCLGRAERGQTHCVKCRAVLRKLAEEAER